MHFYATNARDMRGLIRLLEKTVPELKKNGFAGAYGDTPNTGLRKILKKRFGAFEMQSPGKAARKARRRYNLFVSGGEFPEKYSSALVRRLALRF